MGKNKRLCNRPCPIIEIGATLKSYIYLPLSVVLQHTRLYNCFSPTLGAAKYRGGKTQREKLVNSFQKGSFSTYPALAKERDLFLHVQDSDLPYNILLRDLEKLRVRLRTRSRRRESQEM